LIDDFRAAFMGTVKEEPFCSTLREASIAGELAAWTSSLTSCLVEACGRIGWRASAKGHECQLLPIRRSEYLALDLMAFPAGENRWLYPSAAMELENSRREDQIAYSLWKVLAVRADLRAVFCYRKDASDAPPLIQHLKKEVVEAMGLSSRLAVGGRTLVVVGSRSDATTFPYGFFKWWELNMETGGFDSF